MHVTSMEQHEIHKPLNLFGKSNILTDGSLTCRHGRVAVELFQCVCQSVCFFLLNKGLETVELLQERGGLVSTGYAAQKVVHHRRLERELSYTQRSWRRKEEVVC